MSCYEWSHGTIILPSAQYAPFRQHIQKAMSLRAETLFQGTQVFWASLPPKAKRNHEAYLLELRASTFSLPEEIAQDVRWLLDQKGESPKRVLKSDLMWPTNRTQDYHESDLSLTFVPDKHSVIYSVGENNHAREWADGSILGKSFYEAIEKVKWAHGTGGVVLGNDEYSRESGYENEGAGGSYVVAAYGYLGVKEAPMHVSTPFFNTKGQKLGVETKMGRYGFVGKAVPYVAPRTLYGAGYPMR
jgi:hypothetical protein